MRRLGDYNGDVPDPDPGVSPTNDAVWWGLAVGGAILFFVLGALGAAIAAAVLAGDAKSNSAAAADAVELACGKPCVSLTADMLPLTVEANGACYQLEGDIEWAPATTPITWIGRGGVLRGNGFRLELVNDTISAVYVAPDAQVHFDNVWLAVREQAYGIPSQGITADAGSVVSVANGRFDRFAIALITFDGTVAVDGAHITWDIDGLAPQRQFWFDYCPFPDDPLCTDPLLADEPGPLFAIEQIAFTCFFESTCSLSGITTDMRTTNDDAGPAPIATEVVRTAGFPANPIILPMVEFRNSNVDATSAVDNKRSRSVIVENVNIVVKPSYATGTPDATKYVRQYGISNGDCTPGNLILNTVSIDSREVTSELRCNAFEIRGLTSAVNVNQLSVTGTSPRLTVPTQTALNGDIMPKGGLITVNSQHFTGVVPAKGISLRHVTSTAIDDETQHVVVGNEVWTLPGQSTQDTTVSVDGLIATNGSVGVFVGCKQRKSVSVKNSKVDQAYYGLYAYNESSGVFLRDSSVSNACIGVRQEPLSSNAIFDGNALMMNRDANIDAQGTGFAGTNIGLAAAGAPCTAPPEIWDLCEEEVLPFVAASPGEFYRDGLIANTLAYGTDGVWDSASAGVWASASCRF